MSWILCIANDIYELSLLQNISYSYGKVAGRIFETILPVELYAYLHERGLNMGYSGNDIASAESNRSAQLNISHVFVRHFPAVKSEASYLGRQIAVCVFLLECSQPVAILS